MTRPAYPLPYPYPASPSRFALLTLRACAMALVLARRSYPGERRAHLARIVRYCRARGLRGPVSSRFVFTMAAGRAEQFAESDRP